MLTVAGFMDLGRVHSYLVRLDSAMSYLMRAKAVIAAVEAEGPCTRNSK